MSQSKDEIKYQARQGSISAIISILNDELKDDGITSKAVLDQGKLQLLCEGDTQEKLDQSQVVEKVKNILNQIPITKFRKVIVNSRITKKDQSLWLEEIREDKKNNLLWYEEITIKKLNIFQQIYVKYQYTQKPQVRKKEILNSVARQKIKSQQKSNKNITWELTFGISFGILIIIGGWWFANRSAQTSQTSPINETTETKPNNETETPVTSSEETETDPFYEAVTLANSAYGEGINATTQNQWLEIAQKWQKASELMAKVKPDHPRFEEAQTRIDSYQKNSEVALFKANE
jgi:hypothetical protein